MAVTKTVIDIYEDQALTVLNQTITTNSDANPVEATNLDAGTAYWATVKVTSGGITSNASAPYIIYTYPDVFFVGNPTVHGTSVSFEVATTTDDVVILKCGMVYSTDPYMALNPMEDTTNQAGYQTTLTGLQPQTTYYLQPICYDTLGRIYRNPNIVYVTTGNSIPVVTLFNITPSSSSVTGAVNVVYGGTLTNLEIRLRPTAGGSYITATGYTTTTGQQQWTCAGLTPGVNYTVFAAASSTDGNGTAEDSFDTTASGAYVTLDDCVLANPNTSSIHVEASGFMDTGDVLDTVGVMVFTSNDHTGVPVADVYGQQGEQNLVRQINNLPAGTTLYAFAYADYYAAGIQTTTRVWSASQSVLTVPTIEWSLVSTVGNTTYSGGVVVSGQAATTTVAVAYKASSDSTWTSVSVSAGGGFSITGLTPNTAYDLRATASNASGSSVIGRSFTTSVSTATVVISTIHSITPASATAEISYN